MMYQGICLDGPRGGEYVTHSYDVMEVRIRPPVPPSYGDSVVALAAVRVDSFRYHAVRLNAGLESVEFWIPEDWYREGQASYTARIVKFLAEQYAR